MHDLGFRVEYTFLLSGLLVLLGCLFYGALNPRRVLAADQAPRVATPAPNYGYLAPVARPLEWTLRQVHQRVADRSGRSGWGWAIMACTALVNLALLPFRILAARNVKAMRALQPEIEAINARYKRKSRLAIDPQQSEEISELYRRHKTHPMSGCIPAIGPFAVLAAFYSVLTHMPELHGAAWLWIADLSRPEQLPIRILPLAMIATQLVVGRLTPSPSADPKMQRTMALMPLLFGFLFYGQPSALMLYWVTGNLLGIAQQWWLGRRYA